MSDQPDWGQNARDTSPASTIESYDDPNDDVDDWRPRGPRFFHGAFTVDDPYLMAAIRNCGLWPNAPHRPLAFSSDWTTEHRQDPSSGGRQWILHDPNQLEHVLSPGARPERYESCSYCDASEQTCTGGFPCTQCSNLSLPCDTTYLEDEAYHIYYDGPSTLRFLDRHEWRPTEDDTEFFAALVQQAQAAPVVGSVQQKGGSRQIQPTSSQLEPATSQAEPSMRTSRRRAVASVVPRRHGRLVESPPMSIEMLQNYHEVTFAELMTFLPRWYRRRPMALRIANSGIHYNELTGFINFTRDYHGPAKQCQANSLTIAIEQTMRKGLHWPTWTWSTHDEDRANEDLEYYENKEPYDLNIEDLPCRVIEKPLPMKNLAIGVTQWPRPVDQHKLTAAVDYACAHPDEGLMFPDDMEEAAKKQLGAKYPADGFEPDDKAFAKAWAAEWARIKQKWIEDHAAPVAGEEQPAPRAKNGEGKKRGRKQDRKDGNKEDPDHPGQ